jgi:glucose-1-phosphate adenylyltransferase
MFKDNVMGIILAGGAGKRLEELTSDVRAQPAVPFGGKYRIIDFILSSFFNSQIKKLYVLIQHKSLSLVDHIKINWSNRFGSKDEYIRVTGPMPPNWQKGTADSVYQNLSRIKIENPDK